MDGRYSFKYLQSLDFIFTLGRCHVSSPTLLEVGCENDETTVGHSYSMYTGYQAPCERLSWKSVGTFGIFREKGECESQGRGLETLNAMLR